MLNKLKSKFLGLMKPVQIVLGKLGRREPLMNSAKVLHSMKLIEPGDILLSYEGQRLTNWFIPGKWDHAAIISNRGTIVEAVGNKYRKIGDKTFNLGGVKEVDLAEWLFKKDHVCILRPLFDHEQLEKMPKQINQMAAANALKYLGQAYDYAFNINNENVYCSELVYLAYEPEHKAFMNHINGEILPQDYLKMVNRHGYKYTILEIYNSRKEQDSSLLNLPKI